MLLRKHTIAELQQIAIHLGAATSGTKADRIVAIRHAVVTAQDTVLNPACAKGSKWSQNLDSGRTRPDISVVSVDMGIRNLAYAHFTCSLSSDHKSRKLCQLNSPILKAWRRRSVGRDQWTTDADTDVAGDAEERASDLEEQTAESFEPIHLAAHAYSCAKHFLQLKPTHVLIERQRFRSSGQAAVQEWSLRVGVFEGMLYAALKSLIEEQGLDVTVAPVLPSRVNRYWLRQHDRFDEMFPTAMSSLLPNLSDSEKVTGKVGKRLKSELVVRMLNAERGSQSPFQVQTSVKKMIETFLDKFQGGARRTRLRATLSSEIKKVDDLSDCLLQGLAWVTWQSNCLKLESETDTE